MSTACLVSLKDLKLFVKILKDSTTKPGFVQDIVDDPSYMCFEKSLWFWVLETHRAAIAR
jgi:hypothetical protein